MYAIKSKQLQKSLNLVSIGGYANEGSKITRAEVIYDSTFDQSRPLLVEVTYEYEFNNLRIFA